MINTIIIGIWILNVILAGIFSLYYLKRGEKVWISLLFVVLPVFGFCLYYIAKLYLNFNPKFEYDRELLVNRFEIEGVMEIPLMKKELDVVSIEDALAVSSNQEKRFLILEQLKKDMDSNYKVILQAGADSDSESAHYVATSKMEVYRKKHEKLKVLKEDLEKHPEDSQMISQYLKVLSNFINSELLVAKEATTYKAQYSQWFERLQEIDDDEIETEDNTMYITYLIELNENNKADHQWKRFPERKKDEEGYLRMLKMYYEEADKRSFYHCLNQLEQSDIVLSAKGLKILRLWKLKR